MGYNILLFLFIICFLVCLVLFVTNVESLISWQSIWKFLFCYFFFSKRGLVLFGIESRSSPENYFSTVFQLAPQTQEEGGRDEQKKKDNNNNNNKISTTKRKETGARRTTTDWKSSEQASLPLSKSWSSFSYSPTRTHPNVDGRNPTHHPTER